MLLRLTSTTTFPSKHPSPDPAFCLRKRRGEDERWREKIEDKVLRAATNAAAAIAAIYQWVDMVDQAGGTGSIAGIAKCHAMIASLNKNRKRTNDMIITPLRDAIKEAKA